MSKQLYVSPMFLANGTIHMTASQLAELGLDDSSWDEFWEDAGDIVNEIYPDFNINNESTWPDFFDPADSETWDKLTDEP